MPDEQLTQELERGTRAREVLDHPLFVEAFDALRERCLSAWEYGKTPEVREEAWRTLQVAKSVRQSFVDLVTTGKMAEIALEKKHGRAS